MSSVRVLTHPWEALTLTELDQEIARRAYGAEVEERETSEGWVTYWRSEPKGPHWSVLPAFHQDLGSLVDALEAFAFDKPDLSNWALFLTREGDGFVWVALVVGHDELGGFGQATTPSVAFAYALLDLIDHYHQLKEAQLPLFPEVQS